MHNRAIGHPRPGLQAGKSNRCLRAVAFLVTVVALQGCEPIGSGSPTVAVEIARMDRTVQPYDGVTIEFRMYNDGVVVVRSATVNISLETDVRTYHRSVYSQIPLHPGEYVYISQRFDFEGPGESCSQDDIRMEAFAH